MKPNRMIICTKVLDILDEVKGDIAEKRDFLKMVNDLVNKPGNSVETFHKYMKGGNNEK